MHRGTRVTAVLLLISLAGCGGSDEKETPPPRLDAEETARSWVAAVNAGHYEQACDLTWIQPDGEFFNRKGCVNVLRAAPFGTDLEIERFSTEKHASSQPETSATISSRQSRAAAGDRIAPREIRIERQDGDYRVHFEISVIK